MTTQVITFLSIKGGVSKTTSTCNLASWFAFHDFKVLVIDLDHAQAHCQNFFSHKEVDDWDEFGPDETIYKIFFPFNGQPKPYVKNLGMSGKTFKTISSFPFYQIIKATTIKNLDLLLGSKLLGRREYDLIQEEVDHGILRRYLEPVINDGRYDFIFIDTHPSIDVYSLNALKSNELTHIIIPMEPEELAIQGVADLLSDIFALREEKQVNIIGAFFSKVVENEILTRLNIKEAAEAFPNVLMNSIIHRNTKMRHLPRVRKTIWEYSPKSQGAKDYEELAKEILSRLGLN